MRRKTALTLACLALPALSAGPAPRAAGAEPPWWRSSFPPAATHLEPPLPPVQVDPRKVSPDLSCGSFDLAKIEESGVFLFGWACDPRSGTPAKGVLVLDNGRPAAPVVHVFRERPDVAEALKNRRLVTSGWILWLPIARVTPGMHAYQAYALLAGGKLGRLAETRSIERGERGKTAGGSP